jgi:hypothetical protein
MENKINYWVVGATFADKDMYPEFIENNFWYMGWEHADKNNSSVNVFFERSIQIKAGDRIAIKRLLGKGQTNIKIMAIGVVRKVVKDIVFVDWVLKDMNRQVSINGCVGTIYGPFNYQDVWTKEVFCI